MPVNYANLSGKRYPTGWMDRPAAVAEVLGKMRRPVFGVEARASGIAGSGEGKVVLLYQALTKLAGSFPVHNQTIGDCFAAGTIVLGEVTKPIEEIEVGDRVWTAEGKLTRVVSTRAIETPRPLVKIHPVGGLPITCTTDHRFLVYRMKRVGHSRVNPAYYARAVAGDPGVSKAAVIACYEGRRPEWVAAGDLKDTDCLLTPTSLDPIPPPESPRGLLHTREGRFVAGFFLGNGHASGGTVELAVKADDHRLIGRLIGTLQGCGFNPVLAPYREGCGAVRVRIHSRELVRWCRDQFYRGKGKSFPGWAVGDPEFLDGLYEADGHESPGHKAIDSTSPSIVYGAAATLVRLGFEPTVNRSVRSGGEYANAKPMARVVWRESKGKTYVWRDESFVCRPVRRVEFLEGTTTVYDIGVEDGHHSFLADGHAVHNCVSHSYGICVDVLKSVQITSGAREKFEAETATEVIYAGSRVEIGKGQIGRGDGSVGAWAAECVQQIGTVTRAKHGSIDLTRYDGQRAKAWGMPRAGVPDSLEPMAKEHLVKTCSMVRSYVEARDAISQGYPVSVCSGQGFDDKRDEKGFCKPKGSWAHAMAFLGVDDSGDRPSLCCQNSWGNYLPGPKRHEQPDGSFWVDAEVVDRMLREGDSFALSAFVGFPAARIDYSTL